MSSPEPVQAFVCLLLWTISAIMHRSGPGMLDKLTKRTDFTLTGATNVLTKTSFPAYERLTTMPRIEALKEPIKPLHETSIQSPASRIHFVSSTGRIIYTHMWLVGSAYLTSHPDPPKAKAMDLHQRHRPTWSIQGKRCAKVDFDWHRTRSLTTDPVYET